VGDVDAALAADAEVIVDGTYRTADRHHNPMENAATIADWHDGGLLLHDATQYIPASAKASRSKPARWSNT
jgi:xanthine dehydrogenase YagR molybdenum-binding subunit